MSKNVLRLATPGEETPVAIVPLFQRSLQDGSRALIAEQWRIGPCQGFPQGFDPFNPTLFHEGDVVGQLLHLPRGMGHQQDRHARAAGEIGQEGQNLTLGGAVEG